MDDQGRSNLIWAAGGSSYGWCTCSFYCLEGWMNTEMFHPAARLSAVKQFYYCRTNIAKPIYIIERPLRGTSIVILCRTIGQIRRIIYACSITRGPPFFSTIHYLAFCAICYPATTFARIMVDIEICNTMSASFYWHKQPHFCYTELKGLNLEFGQVRWTFEVASQIKV